MGGRSRRYGGRSNRRRRGRSTVRTLSLALLLRTTFGRFLAFVIAVKTHPLIAAFLTTFVTIWFESGSGAVAMSATPALWGGGCVAWFVWRTRRTGLTVADSAAQLRRQDRVRRQWDLACDEAGLKTVPPLYRWRVRSEGDTVVARINTSAAGLSHAPILSGLGKMAEVVGGGCRETRMKALGHSGWVELQFHWGDPLSRTIRPNDIPAAPKGVAPFGLSDTGKPVGFRILNDKGECVLVPTLISGMSGSGKSFTLWSLLLGFIVQQIPVRLWVADPAGGVELTALQEALDDNAGTSHFKVHRYADTQAGIEKMVQDFYDAMMVRSKDAKKRKQRAHVPTLAEPVNLLIIDELLWVEKVVKAGKDGPLGRVMTGGRKFGYTVVGLAQLAKVDALGQLRDLFLLRLVMKVMTREGVEAALGSGAGWAEKAPAHRLSREAKGVGFVVDADGRDQDADDAVKFRSVFLTDEQVADIARGDMPSGVERFAREEADPKAFKHAVYRLYDQDMALVYVGESNNPGRRWKEHARRSPWWGEVVQDSDHMLLQWCHAATAKDAERAAKLEESHAIETELPRHNDAENGRNPLRVIRGGKGRAA
jgi:hypothetical protein